MFAALSLCVRVRGYFRALSCISTAHGLTAPYAVPSQTQSRQQDCGNRRRPAVRAYGLPDAEAESGESHREHSSAPPAFPPSHQPQPAAAAAVARWKPPLRRRRDAYLASTLYTLSRGCVLAGSAGLVGD